MLHPEILMIPLMMFADYYLTVLGKIEQEKKHAKHFRMQNYELNPVLQKDIARKRLFSPRHFFLTILVSTILIVYFETGDLPDGFVQVCLGALFSVYACLLGRHVGNLLIFRRMQRKPDEISGEVHMTQRLLLSISRNQILSALFPLLAVAVATGEPFAIGSAIGIAVLVLAHFLWIRKTPDAPLSNTPTAESE